MQWYFTCIYSVVINMLGWWNLRCHFFQQSWVKVIRTSGFIQLRLDSWLRTNNGIKLISDIDNYILCSRLGENILSISLLIKMSRNCDWRIWRIGDHLLSEILYTRGKISNFIRHLFLGFPDRVVTNDLTVQFWNHCQDFLVCLWVKKIAHFVAGRVL